MGLLPRLRAAVRSPAHWAWVLPHVVLGVFVVALFALLAVLSRNEQETRRDALARDIQWAEQAMRTHLLTNEEFLKALARSVAAGAITQAAFELQVSQYADENDELALVAWVDADQVVRWSAPFENVAWNAGERLTVVEQTVAFQRAHRTGMPAYAVPPEEPEGGATIEVHVPVLDERRSLGAIVGVYRADGLVRRLAPASFSEKYRLVLETEDRVLAANSSVVPRTDLVERMSLDPPGQGLRLRVSAFAGESRLPGDMLIAISAGLVLLMAWSLWGLSLHTRRRRQAEQERDQLFNLSLDLLCVLRHDGSIVRASPAFERVLGIAPESLPGGSVAQLVHPDDQEATAAELRKLARGEPSTDFHNRCRCSDGSYRWLAWSVNPVVEEGLLYCVAHDITDRKKNEEAVRRESAFRKAMEESVITGLRAVDMEGRITFVNPAFCEMVGYSEEELVGQPPPFPYWPEEEIPELMRITEGWLRGDSPRSGFEARIRRKSGERFPVRMYISPLVADDGRQTGWMGSMIDITEQKRAEELGRLHQERVQQTSRLIAMGEMASSIAHELNQPLAAIANYCSGSVNRLAADGFDRAELLGAMRKASSQAERAGKIIRRVRDFVNKREPNRAPVALAEVVDDAIGFAQLEARKAGIDLRVDVPADLPPVFVDRVMIEQVVLNLVRNGIEAMHPPWEGRELGVAARIDGGGAVELAVADRGRGFAPEDAERMFAPFFTTKPEGMGMGLSICRSIVEFHGGRLWAQPNPGGGSVFRVTLPLSG